jgi:peptide/nickel transport system substrate-binding protein
VPAIAANGRPGTALVVALLLGAAAGVAAHPERGSSGASVQPSGGIVRIALRGEDVDSMDPALAYAVGSWSLIDTTCALLLRPRAVHRPGDAALEPEVAVAAPRVSDSGRTYTFTLRAGFRFSDGTPVRASAFARAIHRTLAPGVASPWGVYARDIVGADAVASGNAREAAGIVARGNTLVIRLKRPVPDLPFRTTSWCAVPPTLPADREGIGAFPAAGPYYVAEHVPGASVEIRRNPFYRGRRPHRVDGFTADIRVSSFDEVVDRVDRGAADWGWVLPEVLLAPGRRLATRYGVNRSRFFVQPGTTTFGFVFNLTRPLFRDNPRLRQAINFAIDRPAVRRAGGGELRSRLTDQSLPPGMPGFSDAKVYPLDRPDLRRARALAEGHTRGGVAVLYTVDSPPRLAAAQAVKRSLAKIGLEVRVRGIPLPSYFGRLGSSGDYDIGFRPWVPDYSDPFAVLNVNFDGRFIGSSNWARLDAPDVNRRLRDAASLEGGARDRAYAALDAELTRDTAPMIAVEVLNDVTFVSRRVGCVGRVFDLTAVCLRR